MVEITGHGRRKEGEFKKNGHPLDPAENEPLLKMLNVGVLCNHAFLGDGGNAPVGDPMKIALLLEVAKAGHDRDRLVQKMPDSKEMAFDPDLKMIDDRNPSALLEVDGGVNEDTIDGLIEAGVDVFVAASAIFGKGDYGENIHRLKIHIRKRQ